MRFARIGIACCALGAVVSLLTGCPGTGTGGGNGNTGPVGNTSNTSNTSNTANTSNSNSSDRGRAIYVSSRCINCHGFDGRGNPLFPGAPVIVGRIVDDLRAQVVNDPDCAATDGEVSNCHPLQIATLTDAQLADLEAYLAVLAADAPAEFAGAPCTDTSGEICTLAVNGVSGSKRGAGILARVQNLFWPQNVTLDPQGRTVITDWNNYVIRRIENGPTENNCRDVQDADGNPAGRDCVITNIISTGSLGDSCSTTASPIQATNSTMNHPVGVLYDDLIPGQSNIMIWGWHQWKIKYIPVNSDFTTGEMFCLWGNGRGTGRENIQAGWQVLTPRLNADGTPALDMAGMPINDRTLFNLPSSCVYDDAGDIDNDGDMDHNFYISDQGNLRIRIIEADSNDQYDSVATFIQTHLNNNVRTFAGGLRDSANNFRRTTDYDSAEIGVGSGDGGPASMCTFNVQAGFDAIPQMRMALNRDVTPQLLYVADSENDRIRVINLETGIIDSVVGGGTNVSGDNVPADQVQLNAPSDVDLQPGTGNLLITDTFNHCVRLFDVGTGMVRTIAGVCGPLPTDPNLYYAGDGGPATAARLQEPGGAYIDADGTVYIADTLNHRVRRVNP